MKKRLLKIARCTVIGLLGLTVTVTAVIIGFLYFSPQIGGTPSDEEISHYRGSASFEEGKFQNQTPTSLDLGLGETLSLAGRFLFDRSDMRSPTGPLPFVTLDSAAVSDRSDDIARLTWFGHSACLLEIDGKKIFIDPMLGQYAGPVSYLSPGRYNETLPLSVEALPWLDAVVISHDHYDHLDYGSILGLKAKVGHFYVPLGVGAHLRAWGVGAEKITELNWGERVEREGFTFICAPARHFSGRGFSRNTTLWSSWIIQSPSQKFYFSGDSGYGPHFREIGERYGPFDFVMMECGQYNTLWQDIHMMPEETVQATIDVRGRVLLPIHWGAFTLAMHAWTDPIIRVSAEAVRRDVLLATPRIGEAIDLHYGSIPKQNWW